MVSSSLPINHNSLSHFDRIVNLWRQCFSTSSVQNKCTSLPRIIAAMSFSTSPHCQDCKQRVSAMICSLSSINDTTTKPTNNSKRCRSSKMELPGVPYRISHEEHPYSYALNIFDDIVDGAEDDDINDDNDTVKTKQRK